MSDSGPQIPVAVGIVIGLLSSLVQSLGLTIQRKSHMINESKDESLRKVEHKRPLWILGFAIFITSNIFGTIFQVGALPIVVLAPLGAVSLLWNALFARFMLGDVFTPWMVLGTILITGGAILIAIFGVVPEPTHSLEDLVRLFGRTQWIVFSSVLGGVVLAVLVTCHIVEYTLSRRQAIQLPLTTPPGSPLTSSKPLHPATFNCSAPPPPSSRAKLFLALSFAAVSGTLSGLCLLFAKSGVELLILTVTGHGNQFGSLTVLWGGGGLVVLALAQLYYLNHSLKLSSPTLICPLAFSFYNLSSVFGGLIYFDQFQLLTGLQLGLVCLGIAVLLVGVGAVSLVGDSGVDVGVWAEEEEEDDDCPNDADAVGWFDQVNASLREEEGGLTAAVEGSAIVESPHSEHPPASLLTEEPTSILPSSTHQHPPPRPPPIQPPSPGRYTSSSHHPQTHSTPSSPLSPNQRRRSSAATSHYRYTSLLPALGGGADEPPARAGFSIGLGAASPGFVLRPTNFGGGHARTGSGNVVFRDAAGGEGEEGQGHARRRGSSRGWLERVRELGGGGNGREEEEGRVRLD